MLKHTMRVDETVFASRLKLGDRFALSAGSSIATIMAELAKRNLTATEADPIDRRERVQRSLFEVVAHD